MDDLSTECFDSILNLAKELSEIQEGRRKETEKLEQLLKKVARQSYLDYDEFSREPVSYNENEQDQNLSEEEKLVNENYQLLYQIKKQEFIKRKTIELIEQYKELITSIKYLIIEQDSLKPKIEKEFVTEKILPQLQQLGSQKTITSFESRNININNDHYKKILLNIVFQLKKLNIKEVNDYIEEQKLLKHAQ